MTKGDAKLHGYYDTDYAGDKEQRRSVLGNLFFFRGGVILALSKRQLTVTLLTTEAEYYTLLKAVSKAY